MCGIVGVLAVQGEGRDAPEFIHGAVAALHHRGPDASGAWFSSAAGVGLGHARLAIIDPSPLGAQPMASASGRFHVTFNGEIYNHPRLRKLLEADGLAPAWRGHSDTETLLACFEAWGIQTTLKRLVGMFALGIWDGRDRSLTLVRDRLGEKPMYYGRCGNDLVFASELKALRKHPEWKATVNRDALALLLRFNYIPFPHSIHDGIKKLPPGTMVTFSRGRPEAEPTPYWDIDRAVVTGTAEYGRLDDREAADRLEDLLFEAVRGQMLSDVPLGAFLSGGIDSSVIVALMQRASSRPVRTFTLGFHESGFNEAEQARAVAKHLQTDHTEMYLSPSEARDIIPTLPFVYDEPFADSSQIPTVLVSQLARRNVTVALTGDGADELLGGYGRYALGRSALHRLFFVPRPLRRMASAGLAALEHAGLERAAGRSRVLRERLFKEDRVQKLVRILAAETTDEIGLQQSTQWKSTEQVVLGSSATRTIAERASEWLSESDPTERLMLVDLVSYLPGDILTKVDRAAMSVSLETRVPFLDHRLVELALGLPVHMKIRGNQTKWILREVLARHVPRALFERPKMGFGVPVDRWLRGPLRDWAETLLAEDRLRREGYFDPAPIRQKWREHVEGTSNWHLHLWSVLMFQAWLEGVGSTRAEAPRRVS